MKHFLRTIAFFTFIFLGNLIAQSYHTITIDGTNDFTASTEQLQTTSGTDLYAYVTWDADYLYFGFSGSSPAGTVTDNNRVYHIYIDTDPTGSNGTTDGETWRWDPTLPINADYHYAFKTYDNSETKRAYSGGSWTDATISTSNYKGSGYWELSISRSDIGSPSEIKVLMYVEEDWDGGSICGGLPSDLFTNTSTQGAITFNNHYQGYTLDADYTPNNSRAHDYVMRKNSYVISLDGGKSFGINDGNDKLDVTNAWTFEAWINVHSYSSGNYDCIMDRRTVFSFYLVDDDDDDYAITFAARNSSGKIIASIDCDGSGSTSANMLFDHWYHVAATYDGTTARLYVNGTEMDSDTDPDWVLTASTNAINIGGRYWGSYSRQMENADIDEIRMSDIARSIDDMHTSTTDNAYMVDENTIFLMHLDDKGDSPTYITGAGLTGTTFDDNITSADYVVFGTLPLPVELTSFTANVNGNNVILHWQTATEVNNYGFEIERSTGKTTWSKIGFVEGNGTSNSPKEYSFTDVVSQSGKYSYRLKQIDIDGSYKYSDVVEVNIGTPEKFELGQNYPNPFNPTTTIKYSIPNVRAKDFSPVQLTIYDVLGRKIATLVNKKQSPGNYSVNFNASNLTSGIYFYTLRAGSFVQTRKMILIK